MYLESGDAPNLFFLSSKKITDDDLVIFEISADDTGLVAI